MKKMIIVVFVTILSGQSLVYGNRLNVYGAPISIFQDDDQKEKEIFKSCLAAAENGDSDAQNELGSMYAEGRGTEPNNEEGVKWFRKSAEQGNAYGACNLAFHYAKGEGVPVNKIAALKWIFIAHSLDSLNCYPDDFIELIKPTKRQLTKAGRLALAWLRSHKEYKNDFGKRPWDD
jgi:TPR repeat protein